MRDLVTFHLFFEEDHVPENFTTVANLNNKVRIFVVGGVGFLEVYKVKMLIIGLSEV